MPSIIHMPAVAAGATEVVLSQWSVEEGSTFAPSDVYAVIETDKATVDLEPDTTAVLLRHLVPEGASVEIGAPIALVADVGEDVQDVDAALAALGVGVVDAQDASYPERREVPDDEAPFPPGPAQESAPDGHAVRVFASPLARRLAKTSGLEVADLDGTGPGGRIVRRDVERALAVRPTPTAPTASVAPSAPRDPSGPPSGDDVEAVPHSRMRRAVASRLTASTQEVPHFHVQGSAVVDGLLALRTELRSDDLPLSVNDLVVRAVGHAHRAVPAMNVVWSEDAVLQHRKVDVGVAAATERGLLTPVVRDVVGQPLHTVVAQTRDLLERARSGGLAQHDLEGGTVSVSNLGMFGVEDFSAIINPPQSSILAVGGVRDEVVAVDGTPTVAKVLRYTLSVDHRPLDGAVAARWMRVFTELLEHPVRILA